MSRNRDTRASSFSARMRPAVRRLAARIGPLDRALSRPTEPGRDDHAPVEKSPAPAVRAAEPNAAARGQAQRAAIFSDFFRILDLDGDLDRAMLEMTRRFIGRSEPTRARTPLQVFARYEQLRPVAEVALALVAYAEGLPDPAWALFTRNDLSVVLRWGAIEYFELAFATDPDAAADALTRVLDGDVAFSPDVHVWLQIGYYSLCAQRYDLARAAVQRAGDAMAGVDDESRLPRLQRRLSNLSEWLDREQQAATPDELGAGEIPFALVGYQHPDWFAASANFDDFTETLSSLGHLLRHDGLELTGSDDLVSAATQLRLDVAAERRIPGEKRTVRLYEVDRDVSRLCAVPDGTWVIVSEWFAHPLSGERYDLPLDPRLNPIFVSFHITPDQIAVPGAVDYLKAHAPIGCADWDSVFLLHARGVPAFFSGTITSTVDEVVARQTSPRHDEIVYIDVDTDEAKGKAKGNALSQEEPELRGGSLGANLVSAAAHTRELRDRGARVVAGTVRCYLAARAVGCATELRAPSIGDHRVIDYVALSDDDFAAQQRSIADKLATALTAVLAGKQRDEVYEAWRQACADDVAHTVAEFARYDDDLAPNFDVDLACDVIRAASVEVRPSGSAGVGTEINVEFSVDQNYKHQLEIVLDSVVQRTERPVHAYILCRGFGQDDYRRLAQLFPTVSFTWLPTDDVDYGPIPDKIKWATIVTMDRTMLPELLRNVDRIIHFDLDALCLADLGELFDVDMEGTAIAAVDSPQPVYLGGLETFRRATRRLRREHHPDVARELIVRTHRQHPFDFEVFNAGIMVLDLAKMRADGVVRRYLGYIQRFGVNGQVIMNIYVGRERKKVSGDWNRLVRLEIAGPPKVAHWAGPIKPWHGHQYAPGREWWQEQEDHFAARSQGLLTEQ